MRLLRTIPGLGLLLALACLAARRPEAARASHRVAQLAFHPLHRLVPRNHQLRNPVPGSDRVTSVPKFSRITRISPRYPGSIVAGLFGTVIACFSAMPLLGRTCAS